VWTCGHGVGVVVRYRVRAPVDKQVLFGVGVESLVGGDDRWDGGKAIGKVE